MNFWLLKTEPNDFSWSDMANCVITRWDGVKNYQALNNLKKMRLGDFAFFYHSGKEKAIIGIVTICKEYYYKDNLGAVDVKLHLKLNKNVTLKVIKNNPYLKSISILFQPRLSVAPVTNYEKEIILQLSETVLC